MDSMNAIFVKKRDGSTEEVSFDKVLRRMKSLSSNLEVNPPHSSKICNRNLIGVSTELDILGGEICAGMITTHYQISARINVNLRKIHPSFSKPNFIR